MLENRTFLKNILYNGGLFAGSLVFCCFIFEMALRVAGYNPFGEFFENEGRAVFIQASKNPQRIFEAAPGAQGNGWGTQIAINHYGFRGREYSLQKPENTYRIVVIGDSIAFGNNLPAEKNYPTLLEKIFAKNHRSVEVLNLALGGYDTLQEVATLEDIGIPFSPDLVILSYCLNDIGVASGNLNYIKRLKNYGDPIYHSRLAQFIRVQLDRVELINYTETANSNKSFEAAYKNSLADISQDVLLTEKINSLEKLLNETPEKYLFTRNYTEKNRIERLRYALEKLKILQNKNSFDVVVLIVPYLLEDKSSQPIYQSVYQIIEQEMMRLDFSVISPYPEFLDVGLKNLILKKNDGIHPNAHGHEIIAEVLYKNIIAKNEVAPRK